MSGGAPLIVHASAVAVDGRGLLIKGASGSGKSSLALSMMSLGAGLIADDRTVLTAATDGIDMAPMPQIAGLIEARGLGLLRAHEVASARLFAVLDLDIPEQQRLPIQRTTEILGVRLPMLHNAATPSFPAALMQYLRYGRKD